MKLKLIPNQIILGGASFFCFFAALFNGIDDYVNLTAFIVLTLNLLSSFYYAKKSLQQGLNATFSFTFPVLFFALFSLGDAVAYSSAKAFLLWTLYTLVVYSSGLLGVGVIYLSKKYSKK